MRNIRFTALVLAGSAVATVTASCGSSAPSGFNIYGDGGASHDGSLTRLGEGGGLPGLGGDTGGGPPVGHEGGLPCPAGLSCNVSCSAGSTTTVTGSVYDPAQKNPLYNVAVYVPATPLTPMPKGVLTGADACQCGALFTSGALTNTTTTTDGTFKLTNVPVGSNVPLVIQIGKWRRQFMIDVKGCQDNPQTDKSLAFLGTVPASDTIDSMPDIAVSTGSFDTLECLMVRIGVSKSEYVAGAGTSGHIHIFSGGNDGTHGTGGGTPESPPMAGAPTSWTALWDKPADMMPYDVVMLSCEGDETFNSNPDVLESYLNAGGRAFGSHYHYAWFAGSLSQPKENVPPPPADWGPNLADWGAQLPGIPEGRAQVVETLTGTTTPFPKGVALDAWLKTVGALGPAGNIGIVGEKQDVGATKEAQAWLVDMGYTDYLSFDTPINAPKAPDGGPPQYCGRAVFSDIHVSGAALQPDTNPPPAGCVDEDLSAQEKALEFMLFDLSSCVVSDSANIPLDAGLPPIPK